MDDPNGFRVPGLHGLDDAHYHQVARFRLLIFGREPFQEFYDFAMRMAVVAAQLLHEVEVIGHESEKGFRAW